MIENELKKIWKGYENQLENVLSVNQANTIEITKLKVSSQLSRLKPIKWFTIGCGMVWGVLLLSIFALSLLHRPLHLPFVLFMGALAVINAIGVGTYIYHLVLIDQIDNSHEVVAAQRDLAKLKVSTLNVTRLLILQIPFYVSLHLFLAGDAGWLFWVINIPIVVASVALTFWLFLKIDYQNRDQRWFKFLFDDHEWNGVTRSIELLEEIEELERE